MVETVGIAVRACGATMEEKLRAARAAIEAAKRKLSSSAERVRAARAALAEAEASENFFMIASLRQALDAAIEEGAEVQETDELEDAEIVLRDLLEEQRRESLAEYRALADRLLRAAEELDAAARAEHAFRQGRHGGLKSDDFLPVIRAVQASLLPQWLEWAQRRFHDTFLRGT